MSERAANGWICDDGKSKWRYGNNSNNDDDDADDGRKESNKNTLFMYTLYTDFVDRILLHSVTHQFGDMTRKV